MKQYHIDPDINLAFCELFVFFSFWYETTKLRTLVLLVPYSCDEEILSWFSGFSDPNIENKKVEEALEIALGECKDRDINLRGEEWHVNPNVCQAIEKLNTLLMDWKKKNNHDSGDLLMIVPFAADEIIHISHGGFPAVQSIFEISPREILQKALKNYSLKK